MRDVLERVVVGFHGFPLVLQHALMLLLPDYVMQPVRDRNTAAAAIAVLI